MSENIFAITHYTFAISRKIFAKTVQKLFWTV